jgi:predicted ABC-type ATPase
MASDTPEPAPDSQAPVQPRLYLFAGPNGCGKTTFARAYFADDPAPPRFLNADEFARGLSSLRPEMANLRAGRLLLSELDDLFAARDPIALESTLSGRVHVRTCERARSLGYIIELHYLWLPSVELAIERVRLRVQKGGHAIPAADIHRRYHRSRANFLRSYLPLAHEWTLWDNSVRPPVKRADWLAPPASIADLLT